MDNVRSLLERSKDFEEAHYTCKELLEERINRIEKYVTKWLAIGLAANLLLMAMMGVFFKFEFVKLRKRVDYRYFLIKESLESINGVKLDKGNVLQKF
jgi:hypothetical protein